ncbi:Alpha-mannosidase 2C1 [Nowakowskiella sp. JEL0078]|nr:Alpha-mannosidase 2C1 [Nowakowskiella sp. JEL0078]
MDRLDRFMSDGQFSDMGLSSFKFEKRVFGAPTGTLVCSPCVSFLSHSSQARLTLLKTQLIAKPPSVTRLGPVIRCSCFWACELLLTLLTAWSTHWFKVAVEIPYSFHGDEVYLVFNPDCEALIWSTDGTPLQGIKYHQKFLLYIYKQLKVSRVGMEETSISIIVS